MKSMDESRIFAFPKAEMRAGSSLGNTVNWENLFVKRCNFRLTESVIRGKIIIYKTMALV